ncbi:MULTISPECIES: MlaE family ABC transporter permease [Asaia]|uniref:ABC transport system permease protein n=2 Tax=Asaia bogorensis TaxID=91915 RepID=A0A060QG19_9PROT|nr:MULTISPECIES: ABC transporter permease [Asaia]MDL2171942.1 ABC transporter permease [Asaia sp. HumB]MDR6181535.1 phospholipid/cholesterol/gamma-HCH transport system permease protein [Asaia bogorensis NBRC 16594]GBQ72841.1 ABC transporter permease [Asaia bogorensis NBRC 16594]CDG39905.1 Putative ABC transport system permease protein [Asaia bogorensis]
MSDEIPLYRRLLRRLGALTRRQMRFSLMLVGASWGVVREALRPTSWRRTVLHEFKNTLRQAAGGGLFSTLFTAALTGFGIVAQAIYWLGIAGMADSTDSLLATVLVREIAPVLVGIILLGRSAMLSLTQLGQLTLGGELRALQAQGIDPFMTLVMPRALAMMLSSFTLGMVFSIISLSVGYGVCRVHSVITMPLWTFLYDIVGAMKPIDYLGIPLKLTISGFLLSLATQLTGLDATRSDTIATLLPRGFARGILVIMVVNVVLGVTVA